MPSSQTGHTHAHTQFNLNFILTSIHLELSNHLQQMTSFTWNRYFTECISTIAQEYRFNFSKRKRRRHTSTDRTHKGTPIWNDFTLKKNLYTFRNVQWSEQTPELLHSERHLIVHPRTVIIQLIKTHSIIAQAFLEIACLQEEEVSSFLQTTVAAKTLCIWIFLCLSASTTYAEPHFTLGNNIFDIIYSITFSIPSWFLKAASVLCSGAWFIFFTSNVIKMLKGEHVR